MSQGRSLEPLGIGFSGEDYLEHSSLGQVRPRQHRVEGSSKPSVLAQKKHRKVGTAGQEVL